MQNFKESLFIARTTSKEAIKRDGRSKYYLLFIMDILFSINILLTPFQVFKWEIVNEIRKGNKVSITSVYNSIYGKGYGTLLQANVIKRIIFLSIMTVILIFAAILFLVGYGVYYLSASNNFGGIFFWLIPAGILLIMALIIFPYINVSNSYIFNKYPNMSASKVLKLSFYSLRNNGKRRLFAINMLEFLAKFGLILPFIIIALIVSLANKDLFISIGISSLMGALAIIVSFLFYPRISLIALIMRANLFDEIVVIKNSNKFNATFDFDIDYDGDNEKALKKIFSIEEAKNEESSSYQKHLDELTEADKKKKKQEKRANKAIEEDLVAAESVEENKVEQPEEENSTEKEIFEEESKDLNSEKEENIDYSEGEASESENSEETTENVVDNQEESKAEESVEETKEETAEEHDEEAKPEESLEAENETSVEDVADSSEDVQKETIEEVDEEKPIEEEKVEEVDEEAERIKAEQDAAFAAIGEKQVEENTEEEIIEEKEETEENEKDKEE